MRWESGTRPGPRFIERIAEVTGQPRDLFADEDDEEAAQVQNLDEMLRLLVRQYVREETRAVRV